LKFSYNWIRELVDGLDCPPGDLERLITIKTAECEGIEPAGELLELACLARVESVEPIAGSHNVKAVVDTGVYGVKTVVCGAENCRAGLITAYVPLGKKTIGGVESDGMLASGEELGINRDHSGILELSGAPGDSIPGCLPDSVIEIDNKSITHRPDLWGHHGMAREVAAILGQGSKAIALKDPANVSLLPVGAPAIRVQVENPNLCMRYSALVFEKVGVQSSPLWLQQRLTSIGLNPISNIVDMTNFVMAELAQPMHAFDADLLRGDTIFVRNAHAGERFRALNGEEYTLDPSNLVIADAGGAIALAGVIGGLHSAIGPNTRRVVLESATFQAASIRKTSTAVKLRTDASMRFEKSQDPANTVRGIARAIELLQEVSPGIRAVGGVADVRKEIAPPDPIDLPLEWLWRKLGRAIPPDEVRGILERLDFAVAEPKPGTFRVTVPSWRATKDVSIKDDLVEEVGRMVGYDSIAPEPPRVAAAVPPANPERKFQHEVRDLFVDLGFTEAYNYSFIGEDAARAFGMEPAAQVRVTNPIASDQALMRACLVPGIWKNVVENSKHREAFRLFEIGVEIHRRDAALPDEIPHLVAAIYERHGDGSAGLLEVKRAAEYLMPGVEAAPAPAEPHEHPARTADILWQGEHVGRLFELHPSLLEAGRAAILDLDLSAVRSLASAEDVKYTPVRRYPSSAFDLSVLAGPRETVGLLERLFAEFAGPLLESVQYLRQYQGPPFEAGQKSVTFRVTVGSAERTLSSDEVTAVRESIIAGMRELGYRLTV
jgi:phenylalanyl-tRNA synthetase beta chain